MFIIIKPDADVRRWLDRISFYKITEVYTLQKREPWVREHYSHIPEDALLRNIKFFESDFCIGINLSIPSWQFISARGYLRSLRVIDPEHLERNQIHVPDSPEVSEKERMLFLR